MAILFFFIAIGLGAQTLGAQQFPPLEAVPTAHEFAQRITNRNTNWRDWAEAALWASSVNSGPGGEARAAAYIDRIATAVTELAGENLPRDTNERGEYLLDYIHRRFLKSYSARQTRLDEIFVSGRYNCVSSAVLYMILGTSLGLDVEGVITKDHALVTVNDTDVETTNRYGFDPGNRKDFLDAFGKTTGFAYVPAKNYRDRTSINRMELVSLILSNRISALEQANRFAEAIPLAINRAVFLSANVNTHDQNKADFFEDPHQDMMTRLFNLGAHYIKTGKEDDAIAWAEYAQKRYPDPQRWQEMIKTAAHNKLVKLIRAKKIPDAHSALTALQPKLDNKAWLEMESMVLEAEAAAMVNAIRQPGEAKTALAFLSRVGERLPPGRREEMQTAAIIAEANRRGKSRDWSGSMEWLRSSMAQYGANPQLEAAFQNQRQNRISELHNEFASFYNKRNYTQAKASAEKALQEFPNERQLRQNLEMALEALR